MSNAGSYQYPTMESVIYGKPAAEALREEAERLGAKRVYLIASRTLNTTTDEIEKIRNALGDRHAATFDGIPQHTTREVVVPGCEGSQGREGRSCGGDRRRLGG
jgi:alcohol dehydrogenase class IV